MFFSPVVLSGHCTDRFSLIWRNNVIGSVDGHVVLPCYKLNGFMWMSIFELLPFVVMLLY